MKQFLTSTAIVFAVSLGSITQTVLAADRKPYYTVTADPAAKENMFSIELSRQADREVMVLTIKNAGNKNLSVTLNGPDGIILDSFYIGKKTQQTDKAYNFTGADDGLYTVEVTNGANKIKKTIKLERITVNPVSLTVQ